MIEPETISVSELAALSIDRRFGRIADALEKLADAATRIADLGPDVTRIAVAAELLTGTLACLTEEVEGADGQTRCTLRSHDARPGVMGMIG
jgi:hypothetical protein